MGYYEALRGRAQKIESKSLGKKAAKKGLWGSVGRTLGGLAATALTGGAATPWAVGLMAGGGSLLGGAIGARGAGGNLAKDSVWFKDEAEKLQGELGAFGSKNIAESLKGAVTAGIGQKLKLVKDAKAAKLADPTMSKEAVQAMGRGKGLDFAESTVGRGLQKTKTSLFDAYTDRKLGADVPGATPTSSTFTPEVDFVKKTSFDPSMDYRKAEDWRDLSWSERGLPEPHEIKAPSKPIVSSALEESYDMPWETGGVQKEFSEFGKYGAMEESLAQDKMFSEWGSPQQRTSDMLQESLATRNRLGLTGQSGLSGLRSSIGRR